MKPILWYVTVATILIAYSTCTGCQDSSGPAGDTARSSQCLNDLYPAADISPYILPWPVGETYLVGQGNCVAIGSGSHSRGSRAEYAYDIVMPIGTTLIAVRDGTVIFVEEDFADSTRTQGEENSVVIMHEDGTVSSYGHLTTLGALVEVDDVLQQGDVIGISGDSGASSEPHLHFEILACEGQAIIFDPIVSFNSTCRSLPTTFQNTRAHPQGLLEGQSYQALAF